MIYFITAICLYLFAIFWIGVAVPWLDNEAKEFQRREKEDAQRRYWERLQGNIRSKWDTYDDPTFDRQFGLLVEKMSTGEVGVGEFLKHSFPIIRRVNAARIADDLISVQPITSPGLIHYFTNRYSVESPDYIRAAYQPLAEAALIENAAQDLRKEQDREVVCSLIAEEIVRQVFQDHPYSSYYRPSVKGPPTILSPVSG